jgi:hypothetical protein
VFPHVTFGARAQATKRAGQAAALNELAFDAALRQELRSITAAQQVLGELAELPPGPLARLRAAACI